MAKRPSPQKPASTPEDFPQVEPTELFPTNNIRFVIAETAKLIERVSALSTSVDKLGASFEKALDKHSADMKERVTEVKADSKEISANLRELKGSIDSFKGAIKVLGGIYALALVLIAAFLAWYLRPISQGALPARPADLQSKPDLTPQVVPLKIG